MFRPLLARSRALTTALSHTPMTTRALRLVARVAAPAAAAAVVTLAVPAVAYADPGGPVVLAANDLPTVIANLQTWVMGILAAVATLFLVLAGVYWATAGGDPAQVDKAKGALKNALIGYGLAVLAPILLEVVQGIVGG
ncbi:pilin [Micromonospora sp. R77]|uniref:pilin n=1 Tax=Micromonospora sp. R77 TaxID=2925836 RepID=UPI001F615514|nr:pilin [Micromonospora sp. R77]MCI4064059.1 pilin [Micromonospora sp. R77]